jgi:hypothetical protein
VVFGFFTAFVLAGVTATVTEQLPGFKATSLPPETLQIFFEALATVNLIFAFGVTVIPICVASDAPGVLCLTFDVGCAAGAGAAAGVDAVAEPDDDGVFI